MSKILHPPSIWNDSKINVVATGGTSNILKIETGVSSPVENCIPYFNSFIYISKITKLSRGKRIPRAGSYGVVIAKLLFSVLSNLKLHVITHLMNAPSNHRKS